MGRAQEFLSFRATAPSTTFTNATMSTNAPSTIRKFADGNKAYFGAIWGKHQTTGEIRILSPNLNEATQGIRVNDIAGLVEVLNPFVALNPVLSNDQMTFQLTGSGTAGDIEFGGVYVHYDDLPNVNAGLIDADELRAMGGQIAVVENTISTNTGGDISGTEAINAEMEILKRTRKYALLGCSVTALAFAIVYSGIDTGNLNIAVPAYPTLRNQGINFFVYLSEMMRTLTGKPGKTIPVIDGVNQDAFYISAIQDENGADPLVKTYFQDIGSNQ